jgi:hypothetical protein
MNTISTIQLAWRVSRSEHSEIAEELESAKPKVRMFSRMPFSFRFRFPAFLLSAFSHPVYSECSVVHPWLQTWSPHLALMWL